MNGYTSLLAGAVAMAYAIAGIFFLRFWVRARDGLFLSFAIAFWLLSVNQTMIGIYGGGAETNIAVYSLRLIAFVLIIVAIVQKNMTRK
jgi:hypothetical protein